MMGIGGCKKEKGEAVEGTMPEMPRVETPTKTGPAANQNLLTGIDNLSKEANG